jgi:hypothetical protein
MTLIPSAFSMTGNTSALKYLAAPAGPPITTSLTSARTRAGAPNIDPAATAALDFKRLRRGFATMT